MIAATTLALLALAPLPVNEKADYQLGGDYAPPAGVTVVTRDWFSGTPVGGESYDIATSTPTRPRTTRTTSTGRTSRTTGRPSSC